MSTCSTDYASALEISYISLFRIAVWVMLVRFNASNINPLNLRTSEPLRLFQSHRLVHQRPLRGRRDASLNFIHYSLANVSRLLSFLWQDQFILIYKLLLESHIFRDTDISRQEVLQKFTDANYKLVWRWRSLWKFIAKWRPLNNYLHTAAG